MSERELALELENKRLREALTFYADVKQYHCYTGGNLEERYPVVDEGPNRAQQALAQPAPETSRILRLAARRYREFYSISNDRPDCVCSSCELCRSLTPEEIKLLESVKLEGVE